MITSHPQLFIQFIFLSFFFSLFLWVQYKYKYKSSSQATSTCIHHITYHITHDIHTYRWHSCRGAFTFYLHTPNIPASSKPPPHFTFCLSPYPSSFSYSWSWLCWADPCFIASSLLPHPPILIYLIVIIIIGLKLIETSNQSYRFHFFVFTCFRCHII